MLIFHDILKTDYIRIIIVLVFLQKQIMKRNKKFDSYFIKKSLNQNNVRFRTRCIK